MSYFSVFIAGVILGFFFLAVVFAGKRLEMEKVIRRGAEGDIEACRQYMEKAWK